MGAHNTEAERRNASESDTTLPRCRFVAWTLLYMKENVSVALSPSIAADINNNIYEARACVRHDPENFVSKTPYWERGSGIVWRGGAHPNVSDRKRLDGETLRYTHHLNTHCT